MIVTTAGRTNDEMIQIAKNIANQLYIPFIPRMKLAVEELIVQHQQDVLVVGKNRLAIYPNKHDTEPIFFHPNSAMFRVKRLLRGEDDPFIQATKLNQGMSVLDCTFGLGSDSIVASSIVGPSGRVVGIEGNRYIAFLLQNGLNTWDSGNEIINRAMRQIEVIHNENLAFLKKQKSSSFDIVYFDPMFDEKIDESDGIKGLRRLALYTNISEETIKEAYRVTRKRIVLKDHWKSTRFERFGFSVYRRKTAKFHFGVIEKNSDDLY